MHDLLRCAFGHHLATVNPRKGADIDDMVCSVDGVLVVLDDDNSIAQVTQVFEGVEQAGVVTLMQADGGLVQDIEHAGQARADLAGQPDALGFAARQGTGRA